MSLYTVVRNTNNQIIAVEVNGGGQKVIQFDMVRSAINALQDFELGIYEFPEPGLHLKASVSESGVVGQFLGAVGPYYTGDEIEAPKNGWMPVVGLDGFLSHGRFRDDEHRANFIRKHAMLHRIAQGIGFTLVCGPRLAQMMEKALEKMAGGSEGIKARNQAIRSKVNNRIVWNHARKIDDGDLATELVVPTTGGNSMEMFSQAVTGELFKLQDGRGYSLRPRYWNPGDANNIRWWMSFAQSGGAIVQ